jgi:hypothetical protein
MNTKHKIINGDSENHVLACLYLENKIFVNIQKAGLAEADSEFGVKHKKQIY